VLEQVRAEDVDLVVFGGDLAWGPFPRETVERAMHPGLPALYVRGNADREVATRAEDLEGWVAEINEWCAERLDPEQREFLFGQAPAVTIDVDGLGEVLFCHGSPRSDEASLHPRTPDARVAAALEGVRSPAVVCGHTHIQFDRTVGPARLVNAGSVGMPYEGVPGAYWCLLSADGISLRRTDYDFAAAAAAIEASGCPYAAQLAKDVVSPPSPEEAIATFDAADAQARAE
jgi:diadenosine tetraphosphatase ApaH/serine/threonine PP2A family protein phosphatase